MPKLRNVLAGKRAKNNGAWFEIALHRAAGSYGWSVIKIPDGCRQVGGGRLLRVATPFDFVFSKKRQVIFADAKTTSENTFSKSKIKPHQLDALYEQELQGIHAGYIVYFQETKKTIFYSATLLKSISQNEGLSQDQGICLGSEMKIYLDLLFASDNRS